MNKERGIIISGERYIEKQKWNKPLSPTVTKVLMMAMAVGGSSIFGSKNGPERPDVDIISEFKLIQEKKSNLSRTQRDWVEMQFHKNFVKLSDNMTKKEAYQAMLNGFKIRHQNYSSEEYTFMNEDNKLETEDGCVHGKRFDEFWSIYQKWETGWSIYNESK